jgi:hypothetical protein
MCITNAKSERRSGSGNLELCLGRYDGLKFEGYFVEFSGARDLSGIIFQKPEV